MQQIQFCQFLRIDTVTGGHRMVGAEHDVLILRREPEADGQLGFMHRELGDHGVDVTIEDGPEGRAEREIVCVHGDAVLVLEGAKGGGDFLVDRACEPDPQLLDSSAHGAFAGAVEGTQECSVCGAYLLDELRPNRGEPHPAAAALDQPHPDTGFQSGDELTDPRLRISQAFGRVSEVQFLGKREQALDLLHMRLMHRGKRATHAHHSINSSMNTAHRSMRRSLLFGAVGNDELGDMSPSMSSTATVREKRTSLPQWIAVGVLTLSTFLVVTSEMLPVGVLTPMAEGLGISSGATGISLTITGLVSAVTAPIVPRLLGDLDRRAVLAVAMVVLAAGNAITTIAGGFGLLMVSRVVLGVGMGVVWGMASAVATRLVAPRNIALAVSFAVSGVASASVLGVPLGTFVGNAFGWRAAFGSLTVIALILSVALLFSLPKLRRPGAADGAGEMAPRRSLVRPAIVTGLIVIVLLVTAHFAAYTYVRPALEELPQMSVNAIAMLLLIYGVFGLIGNFAAGAAAGRRPRLTVLLLATGITAALVILAVFGTSALMAGIAIALWGVAYGGLSVGAQLWMTAAAPDRVEHVTGLYVGVFTGSIALGAFVGGLLVEGTGIVPLLCSTAALALASLLVGVIGPGPKRRQTA